MLRSELNDTNFESKPTAISKMKLVSVDNIDKVKGRLKRWEGVGTGTQGQLAINSVLFSLSWTLLPVLITDLRPEVVRSSSNQNGFPACQLCHACCHCGWRLR